MGEWIRGAVRKVWSGRMERYREGEYGVVVRYIRVQKDVCTICGNKTSAYRVSYGAYKAAKGLAQRELTLHDVDAETTGPRSRRIAIDIASSMRVRVEWAEDHGHEFIVMRYVEGKAGVEIRRRLSYDGVKLGLSGQPACVH